MEALPVWLQWVSTIAASISSIGVLVAFIQIRITGKQFKTQLKLTEEQFKLLNQGYINLKFNQQLYERGEGDKLYLAETVTDKGQYYATALTAQLENVGNMPISLDMKHCIVYADGKEIYRTPESVFAQTQNTIYPKSNMPYNFGLFPLAEKGLSLQQLFAMNITYDLQIDYYDFNDKEHAKKIDRGMALEGGQILIKRNQDKI
jgi:hypothetical protein